MSPLFLSSLIFSRSWVIGDDRMGIFFHGTGQDIPDHTFSRSHIHGMMHRVIIDPACVGTHHACLSRSRRGRGRGGGRGRRGNEQRTKCKNDKKKRGVWPGSNAATTQEVQQRRNREQQKVCGCLSRTLGDHYPQSSLLWRREVESVLFFWIRVIFLHFFISRPFCWVWSLFFIFFMRWIRVDVCIRENEFAFEFGGFLCLVQPCDQCCHLFPSPHYANLSRLFFSLYFRGIPNKGNCKTSINKQRKEELLQERARLNKEHARMMQLRAQVDGAIRDTLTNESTSR